MCAVLVVLLETVKSDVQLMKIVRTLCGDWRHLLTGLPAVLSHGRTVFLALLPHGARQRRVTVTVLQGRRGPRGVVGRLPLFVVKGEPSMFLPAARAATAHPPCMTSRLHSTWH